MRREEGDRPMRFRHFYVRGGISCNNVGDSFTQQERQYFLIRPLVTRKMAGVAKTERSAWTLPNAFSPYRIQDPQYLAGWKLGAQNNEAASAYRTPSGCAWRCSRITGS
jgi:hypothetical protein